MNVFIEKYVLISGFLAFLVVKVLRKSVCLNVCAKTVLFFVLFQGMLTVIVYAANVDSKLSRTVFFTMLEDKRLQGHVVKRFEAPSLYSCSRSCLRNSWCTSTIFMIPSEENAKGNCELNKHGVIEENNKLYDQQGVGSDFVFALRCLIFGFC